MKNITKLNSFALCILILLQSCVSKKDIYYLQDISEQPALGTLAENYFIQPNDILKIDLGALIPETVLPFNKFSNVNIQPAQNVEIMKLEGYLVSQNNTIQFPILGEISVAEKSLADLENDLKNRLEVGGYLINPSVTVRLLNSRFTILGEVNAPGTYTFTENNISLLQALGLAGDLTINGDRKDVLIIRGVDGNPTTSHLNLTSTDWLNGPYEQILPNDVIIVNPNGAKIKSSAFFGNSSSFVAIASLVISTIILISSF